MKKLFLTITAGFLITGICVWLAGCKKEATTKAEKTEAKANKQSEADRIAEQRIRSFRQQAKTNARVNENMAVADALWYLEATLNYTFCRGSLGIIDPLADTAMITLTETSAGMVEFTEVADQYNNIAAQMQANVAIFEQNKRQYMLVDVMDMGSNNGVVTFRCIMLNGCIPDTTSGNARITAWTGFGPDDNWYYGEGKGRKKADGTIQYVGYDATTVLTNAINTGQGVINPAVPSETGEFYFTDDTNVIINQDIIISNYQVPNQPLNNVLDYYVFYKSLANSPNGQALDLVVRYTPNNEMNFYYDGIKNHVKSNLDAQFAPSNKVIKCCKVSYGYAIQGVPPSQIYVKIYHNLSFNYGVKHEGMIPD